MTWAAETARSNTLIDHGPVFVGHVDTELKQRDPWMQKDEHWDFMGSWNDS